MDRNPCIVGDVEGHHSVSGFCERCREWRGLGEREEFVGLFVLVVVVFAEMKKEMMVMKKMLKNDEENIVVVVTFIYFSLFKI